MDIVILGSGNVAHHLGAAFTNAGHQIKQIYSRNKANAEALASALKTSCTDKFSDIDEQADLYVIAVSDQAIDSVAEQLSAQIQGCVVHCSGATSIDVLDKFANYGVIYPVQSLSKDLQYDSLNHIPFALEANKPATSKLLFLLMENIADQIFSCTSKQRLSLHVSAVFANNFSNALFGIANTIMEDADLSFDLLKPIIMSTAEKVRNHRPQDVQTGPASRNDLKTMEKHLNFISGKPNWVQIYQHLSEEISSTNKS